MSWGTSFEAAIQEAVVRPLQRFAARLRRALSEPAGPDPAMTLQQNASEEVRLAAQLRAHVSLMPNAHFRDTLKHLAEETEQSAALLAEQVRTPAASWPTPQAHEAAAPTTTSTFWRLLAADLAAVNALANRYQAQLGWMADAGQQALLYQLRAIKRRHRRTLLDLLTRIDSFAKPEINPGNASDHA